MRNIAFFSFMVVFIIGLALLETYVPFFDDEKLSLKAMISYTLLAQSVFVYYFLCTKGTFVEVFFYGFCGLILFYSSSMAGRAADYLLSFTSFNTLSLAWLFQFLILFVITLIMATLIYYCFAKKMGPSFINTVSPWNIAYFILSNFAVVTIALLTEFITDETIHFLMICLSFALGIISVIFNLNVITSHKKEAEEQENYMQKKLMEEKIKQYEILKENMDLINVRCHDLKHHFATEGVEKELLGEALESVKIYDSFIKTGNDTLNTVLSRASLNAEKKDIEMDVMCDGTLISFMSGIDIYSLFGNSIDNAIDYLSEIEDKEKRFLRVELRKNRNTIVIYVENYYDGPNLVNVDTLLTTKLDKESHGFGIKSVRMIAEKYQGSLSIKTENNLFKLIVLIPIFHKENH